MNKLLLIFTCFLSVTSIFAQEKLVKDMDADGVKDTVYFNIKDSIIVCKLSSKKFKQIHSLPITEIAYASSYGIRSTKNGFEFLIAFNRYGIANQFRYEKSTQSIRLIGMRRRESDMGWYGANGTSSVNLLTGNYVGNWQYNDEASQQHLIEIPTIKTKMYFPKTHLQNFNEKIYNQYNTQCTALFGKYKAQAIKKSS